MQLCSCDQFRLNQMSVCVLNLKIQIVNSAPYDFQPEDTSGVIYFVKTLLAPSFQIHETVPTNNLVVLQGRRVCVNMQQLRSVSG